MDVRYFYCQCIIISALFVFISADISTSGIDDIAKDIKEKTKSINPSDVKKTIVKHPAAVKWKNRCIEKAGRAAFRDIERSVGRLVSCFTKEIKFKTLQKEVNASIDNGELDTVFKKYCGKRDKLMDCVEEMIGAVEVCSDDKEKEALNITRELINAGIDFTCHNDGDRIAIFMAEKGIECVKNHADEIKTCIEEKVSELKGLDLQNITGTINPEDLGIYEDRCNNVIEIHRCIVFATEKCDDPTPANVLDSLFIQMRKVTPCPYSKAESSTITAVPAHAPPSSHMSNILPLVLTLFTAALTAANILL